MLDKYPAFVYSVTPFSNGIKTKSLEPKKTLLEVVFTETSVEFVFWPPECRQRKIALIAALKHKLEAKCAYEGFLIRFIKVL